MTEVSDVSTTPARAAAELPGRTGQGELHLVLQGGRWLDQAHPPQVLVGGAPRRASYGVNVLAVPAGPVRVEVACQRGSRYGVAHALVDVPAGAAVPLFYAAPHHELAPGRLGPAPQRRAGVGAALALALLAAGLVVLVAVLALAGPVSA